MMIAIGFACVISLLWMYEIDREREREAKRLEQAERRREIDEYRWLPKDLNTDPVTIYACLQHGDETNSGAKFHPKMPKLGARRND